MTPETALDHLAHGRLVLWHEVVKALLQAVDQRDQARTERDSLAAALSVAQVAL